MIDCKKIIMVVLLLISAGCQQDAFIMNNDETENAFELSDVAKTDIDMVFDHQVQAMDQHLRDLMLKLYLRNPGYWRGANFETARQKVDFLFVKPESDLMKLTSGKRSIESIQLAFEDDFSGDRVLAFVFGLRSMVRDSYNGKRSFFIPDQLDPQKLYNSARNFEVAVWKLSNDHQLNGELFLISNELAGPVKNLSFERLFGKLIAIQDQSAQVVADTTNRTIKNVIQGVARFVFLPL